MAVSDVIDGLERFEALNKPEIQEEYLRNNLTTKEELVYLNPAVGNAANSSEPSDALQLKCDRCGKVRESEACLNRNAC